MNLKWIQNKSNIILLEQKQMDKKSTEIGTPMPQYILSSQSVSSYNTYDVLDCNT